MAERREKIMRKVLTLVAALAIIVTTLAISYARPGDTAAAACTALATTYGSTTNTVTVPATGTYHVYLRVKTSDSTVNSVGMQIDQTNCNMTAGGTSLSANTWTWVDWQGGNRSSLMNVSLAAGSHSFVIAGKGTGLQVDRVILSQDSACVPSGTGDNCTTVTATPVAVPVVSLSSSTTSTTVGKTATLTWSSTNAATSCTATGDWTGTKATSGTFTTPVLATAKTYTYSLVCANAGGSSTTKTVSVVVAAAPVPVVTLAVSPGSGKVGDKFTLTWTSNNSATGCTSTGDWSGSHTANGSLITGGLMTARTYNFGIYCTNAAGNSVTKTVTVIVTPAVAVPVVTISATPASLTVGATAKITWSATNTPTSCAATGDWTGAKDASGTFTTAALTTVKTYSYSLTCTNSGGTSTTKTATVVANQVPVPVVSLSVTPTTATVGSKVTLTWSSTNNATSCTSAGEWSGARATSGTITTGALTNVATYTYSLTCSNAGGASATKTVTSVMTAAPVVPTYLSGDINKDGSVNLLDFSIFQANYGKSGTAITVARADINGDGTVNLLDFSVLSKQFGETL